MVLQRWQSVYLAVAAVLMVVSAFFAAIEVVLPQGVLAIGALYSGFPGSGSSPDMILLTLTALIVIMLIITTFSYRDLRRQMRLCAMTMAITVAHLVTIGALAYLWRANGETTLTAFNLLPLLALVCMWLARGGMARDKKLLSESDRLR